MTDPLQTAFEMQELRIRQVLARHREPAIAPLRSRDYIAPAADGSRRRCRCGRVMSWKAKMCIDCHVWRRGRG